MPRPIVNRARSFFFIRFFSLSLSDFLSIFRLLRWYQNHISFSTYNPLIVVSSSTLLQLNVRLNGNQIDLFPYYKTHSHPIQYSRKWERNRNNNEKNEKFQFRSNCFLLLLPRPKRTTKNEKETDREWFRCWRSKTETRSHFALSKPTQVSGNRFRSFGIAMCVIFSLSAM